MISGATNGEVVLSVRDVSFARGPTRVLDEVSFDVIDRIREGRTTGQVVSLLGRSGAGKSTLLRIIAGLEQPDRGSVSGATDVGIVFQDYPLLRHRTVVENLTIAGAIGGLDRRRARQRASELLARMGLDRRAEAWPAQLSGGERQRVAIAQQLVLGRRVLLMDEPFSGLDPKSIQEVSTLITEVANEHELNTVIIVTHDVRAALAVSDTVLLLDHARIVERYDLVELGIAWEVDGSDAVSKVACTIERRFKEL